MITLATFAAVIKTIACDDNLLARILARISCFLSSGKQLNPSVGGLSYDAIKISCRSRNVIVKGLNRVLL